MLCGDATHEIFVATLNRQGILLKDIQKLGFHAIPEFSLKSFYDLNFVRQVRRCAKYLRDNRIDIIQTHDFYTNVFGMAAASLAGVSGKITSKRETGGMRSKLQDTIENIAFGRSDAIVVNSEAVRQYLEHRSVKAEKIRVIYNGVDLAQFENIKDGHADILRRFDLPAADEIRLITMVANLRHSVKNVPMLLEVAKIVSRSDPNAHFVIAGEGELENELKQSAEVRGVSKNVHFIGRCGDVPALLRASYACVLTSANEGFSNSILEYMAVVKPVVATNVGGASEAIVDGTTGYLVESGDSSSMADRLIELLQNESHAQKMGIHGKARIAEKFSSENQLAKTLELYEQYRPAAAE